MRRAGFRRQERLDGCPEMVADEVVRGHLAAYAAEHPARKIASL
jgi:hypothetical protein